MSWLSSLQESPRKTAAPPRPVDPAVASAGRGLRFGRAEVLEVTGLDDAGLDQLIEYGLVVPTMIGGEATFDATSVGVVRSLLPFLRRGVEARHLRMFRNAADREAGFYEQMILPLLKQRNPKARDEAAATLDELMSAGDELGRALVRQALRNHLGD